MILLARFYILPGLVLLLMAGGFSVDAAESITLELAGGQELEISKYAGSGESLVLWLPSERGPGDYDAVHARALAKLGHEVWLPDLHDAYFLQPERASISKIPVNDIVALIDAATRSSSAEIVLMSSTRGAQLALIAARQWQLQNPGNTAIQGILLMEAYLYEISAATGRPVDYLPIVNATNLPVYLLDAQFSTTAMRMQNLAAILGGGGSQVYTQILSGVRGGFQVRADSDLDETSQAAKQDFANIVNRAMRLLAVSRVPRQAVFTDIDTVVFSRSPPQNISLIRLDNPIPAPPLRLSEYRGQKFSLAGKSGKLVLINFWASWCGPCVREIPSLHRLHAMVDNPGFEIVTVNMGESRARIDAFLQQVPIDFPILMDLDGEISKLWKVYFYPSNYLVDQQGNIRYIYMGALEWDSPENIGIIENLLHP